MALIIIALLIPAAALALIMVTSSKKKSTPTERVDFIAQAASHIHGDEVESIEPTDIDYNYDVVGESFQRDHLVSLVKSHDAFNTGEILTTAILEPEPTNPFDSTAVKVVIEGVQVGYIAKFDSGAVTEMIRRSGKKKYEVPAHIGFDTESSQPFIGVRIALTVE
jgi:hypothetical protein